jgi:hypothetical protein
MPEPHRNSVRRNLSQPPEYWTAWESTADKLGMSLSEWIASVCNAQLPLSVQRKLPERPRHGGNRRGKRDE